MLPELLSADRPVNKRMPAPNSTENMPLMVPSKNTELIHHTFRFQPVDPPLIVMSSYDMYNPNPAMFMSRMPHTDTPRIVSMALILLALSVGVSVDWVIICGEAGR